MATLKVSGNVKSVGITSSGKTFLKVWDKFIDHKQQERNRVITVWFDEDLKGSIHEGDFVFIEGDLGGRIEEYESKVTMQMEKAIAYSINNPKLLEHRMEPQRKAAALDQLKSDDVNAPF